MFIAPSSACALPKKCAAKDVEKSRQVFSAYCSTLDKAASKGIIKKNTAIRRKRRAAARLATLKPATPQG
ncbi:MAG: 30S ribosomal protein S20 [Lentisphaerae bacterium]|nr:30S ribosomal protein S20 [Lentisphaerota bacterium]